MRAGNVVLKGKCIEEGCTIRPQLLPQLVHR
jgi:hypothetical protein